MCGIAGFMGFANGEELALSANKIQHHRGPDGNGIFVDNSISIAHTRLAIQDLDPRANQPFRYEDLVLSYNGEIYNYQELKEILIREGYRFTTNSDTEVVLLAYHFWGYKAFEKFDGMFALAIYHQTTGKLVLARDPFGIKPLYYFQTDQQFCFASELKTLIETETIPKEVNQEALVNLVNFLWIPGDDSMFKDVFKLTPGTYLVKKKGLKGSPIHYWKGFGDAAKTSYSKAVERTEESLDKAIKSHLISDAPLGAFLSGGLDSSLLSIKAKKLKGQLQTFTIGTKREGGNTKKMLEDDDFALMQAEENGYQHEQIVIDPSIIQMLPKMVEILDEPIGDPAAINTFLICELAKEKGVKVLLSGMGADELFFGYVRHKAMFHARLYNRIPASLQKQIKAVLLRMPSNKNGKDQRLTRWLKRFVQFAELEPEKAYRMSYSYYQTEELTELFKPGFSQAIFAMEKRHKKLYNEKFDDDLINKLCYVDTLGFMQGLNLSYTDKASMAASVEVRVPFITKEMVNVAFSMPGRLKYKKRKTKAILKTIGEKYLPKSLVYRQKASFGVPIRKWVREDLNPMIDTLLSEEQINKRGLFNYAFVQNMINENKSGKEDHAFRLYQLLSLELWFQRYID